MNQVDTFPFEGYLQPQRQFLEKCNNQLCFPVSGVVQIPEVMVAHNRLASTPNKQTNGLVQLRPVPGNVSEATMTSALDALEPWATGIAGSLIDERIMGPAAASIESDFPDDPLTSARLQHTVGVTYYYLGLKERSVEYLEEGYAHISTLMRHKVSPFAAHAGQVTLPASRRGCSTT